MKNNYYWLYCRYSYYFLFMLLIASVSQFLVGASANRGVDQGVNSGSAQTANPLIYNAGRDFTAGAAAGLTAGLTADNIQAGVAPIISGVGKAVKNSGSELGRDLGGGARDATAGAFAGLGQGVQDAFAEGSDLSKGMTAAGDSFNQGIQKVVHNNAMKAGAIFVSIAGAYFVVQYATPMAFRMIERALTRPKLIIASSKKTMVEYIQSLFSPKAPQAPMVFAPKLEARLNKIARATSSINTKIKQGKTNVKYRNLMLYCPPGTGKTMFAQELAKRSGMEYAFMSGSSFSKFKDGEGVQALDELFAWAKNSKGLMIFIDEAEAFLSKRENMDPQSKAYQLLNNFLNYTGTRSDKFMLVFATNHKDALDSAMYRRIDDLVQMPLPGKDARIGILNLYKNKILMDEKQNGIQFVSSVITVLTEEEIESIALKTKGLSGGDLEGIINSIKTDADIMDPAEVTQELVDTIVSQAVAKHLAFTGGVLLGEVED